MRLFTAISLRLMRIAGWVKLKVCRRDTKEVSHLQKARTQRFHTKRSLARRNPRTGRHGHFESQRTISRWAGRILAYLRVWEDGRSSSRPRSTDPEKPRSLGDAGADDPAAEVIALRA
jgi:hypothetical protein